MMVNNSTPPTMSLYQQIIHVTRYARWNEKDLRRENWEETVNRYMDFFKEHLKSTCNYVIPTEVFRDVQGSLLRMDSLSSMRTLMTAGVALDSCHVANYNCAFSCVDTIKSFSSHMYVLMAGSGSGFSVESKNINKLPEVPEELHKTDTVIVVADSRKGWCVAFNQFLNLLYSGSIPQIDTSKLRPEGARLKTFGGYSSGPKVLDELFQAVIKIFNVAKGRRLKSIEVFDIMCLIANTIVVGGVRRSATICLFDKGDLEMRKAKSGAWYINHPHRAMANISAVFEDKPDDLEFLDFWRDLIASYAGEPGIFNRKAVWEQCERIGRPIRDDKGNKIAFGVNPCSEILLRPNSFCNLTGVAIRPHDTLNDLIEKTRIATIIGTWQSTVTNFDYLPKNWKENVEEERLLGVSLGGIMDHPVLAQTNDTSKEWLQKLREVAWKVNKETAKDLGINASVSVTAVKPFGNSGELYDVSSGIHTRYSPYYIRTIRQSRGDPMTEFLKAMDFPWEVSKQNERDVVFSFPIKSPETAVFAKDVTAIQQLESWMQVKNNFTTHTVSCTIYVRKGEWAEVGAWVYKNFDDITGLSFLPYDDNTYEQAPYQPITKEKFDELVDKMPKTVDWSLLKHYEVTDTTRVSQEFACVGGACELVVSNN
jgi:ribonucleoside-triphosphate reductase (thioredoxin)